MSDDDDRTPMTRTELAMLWDLLGQWAAVNTPAGRGPGLLLAAEHIRDNLDAELTRRFGG